MKFNYTLVPTEEHNIKLGNIYFELPVYGDLLGEEYDVLEELERRSNTWNARLLDLTTLIATEKQISVFQVSQMMVVSELAPDSERFAVLGNHVPEFMRLIAERPSDQERLFAIATVILKRVDPDAHVSKTKQLPMKVVKMLVDFADMEKEQGSHMSYEEAINRYMLLEEQYTLMQTVLDKITSNPLLADNEHVKEALSDLNLGIDELKNVDLSSSSTA
jgi:hypothetical protein